MVRHLPITTIVMLTVMITGCWHYPLVSSKEASLDKEILGKWRCTDLVDIKQEDQYVLHALTKSDTVMNFEIATEGLHQEAISKHVMLYHPNYPQELPFTPPFIIGDAPDDDQKIYCWSTELKGKRYLVFQCFKGPLQTDLKRREDPEFLVYRYAINKEVLEMFDLGKKARKLLENRLGGKGNQNYSQVEMQREILRLSEQDWDLHIRAKRIDS